MTEADLTGAEAPAGDPAAGVAPAAGDTPPGPPAGPPEPGDRTPGRGAPSGPLAWLRRHPWLLPTLVVALAVALPLRGVFRAPGPSMEEGFMLVFPERLLHGDIPNRDYLHLYGPGSIWVLAGFYKVLGVTLWTERLVGLLQIAVLVGAVAWAGRRFGAWPAAVGGVVTAIIIIPPIGVTALAWVGGVALALWSINVALGVLDRPASPPDGRRRTLIVAGLLAGAALLFRPDLAIALGLPLGALLLWRLDGAGRRHLVLGLLAGLSPYLVHLALAGPGNAVTGMVIEPVFDLRPGRRLPFPPPTDHFTSWLNGLYALREFPWPLPMASEPVQIFTWVILLFGVCAALVLIAVWAVRRRSPRGWHLVLLALFAAGLLPQAVQRADTAHLSWVSCVSFGLLPAFLTEALRLRGHRPRLVRAAALVPLALMLLFPVYTYRWYVDYTVQSAGLERDTANIEHGGRSFYYGRPAAADAAEALLADVEREAEPGQRLVVGTGDLRFTPYSEAFLYYLLPELEPGTRYIEMDPGVANAPDSGLADEMRRADIVILSTVYDDWHEPNTSTEAGSDEPNRVLEEEFCLEGSYGSNGPDRAIYELHLRCDARAGD